MLFYHPEILFQFEKLAMLPNFYNKITDFCLTDTKHYYCYLEHIGALDRYSIEDEYPLQHCVMNDLPQYFKETKSSPIFWYHEDYSPFGHPSLVYHFKTLNDCIKAEKEWVEQGYMPLQRARAENINEKADNNVDDNIPVMEWNMDQKRWVSVVEGEHPFFRAQVSNKDYFLFISP